MSNAFSPWPSFTEEEGEAVKQILLSNGVNQWTGETVRKFEDGFADFCGVTHAAAYSNGTTALEGALRAVGLSEGDEVIVTPRSFVASASAVVTAGGTPVFADVDLNSQLITPETVAPLLTSKTKAILCVHLAGWPCDMDGFRELVDGRGVWLIEDCAQAHGAIYKGRPVGGLGDIAAWSFCQDKIMTTGGEGGMITTNDEELYRRAWAYKDHGKSYEAVFERYHPAGFQWLHESIGTNARMTALQAAVGLIQLERMPEWQRRRSANANAILDAAKGLNGLRVPQVPEEVIHAWYRCYIFCARGGVAERDALIDRINAKGVPAFSGSCSEIYRERAFTSLGIGPEHRLQNAQALGESSVAFLVHPTLTREEIDRTCRALESSID